MWLNAIFPGTGVFFVNLRDSLPVDHFGVSTASAIAVGKFQQAFATYDYATGILSFYVDGKPYGTANVGQAAFDTREDLRIGSRTYNYNAADFNGIIDDLRVYNRTFSEDEILALHLRESVQPQKRAGVAIAQRVNGFLVGATVADGGSGYTDAPAVHVVGGGGTGAAAHTVVANGIVTQVVIDDAGSGYSSLPSIVIDPPAKTETRATGVAAIRGGSVSGASPIDGGFGYTNAPAVRFIGGGGSGAKGIAVVDGGEVISIQITDPGSGYTNAPVVLIGSPTAPPTLSIKVSKVEVDLFLILGRSYQLQSSADLTAWKPIGGVFVAESETVEQEFDVAETGQFFRIVEMP